MNTAGPAPTETLVLFARLVREAQELTRRFGYVAASVEENIEDVLDFHAAVESLVGAAPVSGVARRLNDVMSDEDRILLRRTRAARNRLVYDFFMDHPFEKRDGTVDEDVMARGRETLEEIGETLRRARDLVGRLELAVSADGAASSA